MKLMPYKFSVDVNGSDFTIHCDLADKPKNNDISKQTVVFNLLFKIKNIGRKWL